MKIADKLIKVDENFAITKYDNGYMVEISGRIEEDEWSRVKLICSTLEEVIQYLREYDTIKVVN